MFVLCSGLEGSGTTSATRVLAEVSGVLGIPTNWDVGELSKSAQQRHQCLRSDLVGIFNKLTESLWQDPSSNYIRHGRDERNTNSRMELLKMAGSVLRMQIDSCTSNGSRPEVIVYHRSMPFNSMHRTPFLHDLPVLANQVGYVSNLVISLRDIPSEWASRGVASEPGRNVPFIAHVELLLNASNDRVAFVRYDDLVNNHQLYVACLSKALAKWTSLSTSHMRQSQMLQSPQISSHPSVRSRPRNSSHMKAYLRKWAKMSHNYPLLVAATQPGTLCP
jgi:hypothetical protein